jgi:hypothetical protein
MSKLSISHHERVEGHGHRWHVHLHGRPDPVCVELPEEERRSLEMSDEEIHAYLPTALQRHLDENRDDELPSEKEYQDTSWDAPVRVMQTHFTG